MNTHSIQWFLCLSVAVHAALLGVWQMPVVIPGNSGQALRLSVTPRSGDLRERHPAPHPGRPAAEEADPQQQTGVPVSGVAARSPARQQIKQTTRVRNKVPAEQPRSVVPAGKMDTVDAVAASDPELLRQETDRYLRDSVMDLISRKLTYPAIARRKGWQGIVKLELHIEADGSISNLQVDETSGYSILDKAAMRCLQYASLPGAAHWLRGKTIDIVVPVEYRLVDS